MLGFLSFLFKNKKRIFEKAEKDYKEKIVSLECLLKKNETLLQERDNIIQESQEDIVKLEKELQKIMKEIEKATEELDSKNEKLQFIAQVINALPETNPSYEKYLKLLNHDYMKYANENDSLAAEAAAFVKLQNVAKQLELLTYDESLLNKSIIAIAGSFSSGKSSFMNSFFKTRDIKLPTGMDQTTAISSYVMNGDKNITGYSYKGGRVSIPNSVFKLFSYGKIEEFNFNMKQIINHIVFKTEFVQDFNNLCFIDTPGFNPGQETKTDYDTANSAIATATSVIWCIDVNSGTMHPDELEILSEILKQNESISFYIILNMADKKSIDELLSIRDEIENQLIIKGIPFEGISLYSSAYTNNYDLLNQPEEYAEYVIGKSLPDFLASKDVEDVKREENLLKNIDEVFDDYINADKYRIKKLENQIRTLRILEDSISSINLSKDDEINYYKARIDTKHYKLKQFDNSNDKDDALFDSLADLRNELKQTIEKDKTDIERATELCTNMKKAVSEVFGHKLSAKKNISEDKFNDSITTPAICYCNNCGKENKQDAKFCLGCGRSFL